MNIHPDWYGDGIEDGEDLHRLDPVEDIQIQIFQKVDDEDKGTGDYRMLIEHDVRLSRYTKDTADDNRVRYASQDFPLDEETAEALLSKGNREVALCLSAQIDTVRNLPNQPEYFLPEDFDIRPQDGEVLGLDTDGNVVLWNAETCRGENSGNSVTVMLGTYQGNLTPTERKRVGLS